MDSQFNFYSALLNSIRLNSTLFSFIQLYSVLFNSIQLNSTLFGFIQLYSALFNSIRLNSALFMYFFEKLTESNLKYHNTSVKTIQ